MNLNTLPVPARLGGSAPAAEGGTTAAAFKEFFLLAECIVRCESLADLIAAHDAHEALLGDLSECIAACQTYLAAQSRESRYASQLRVYCAEVLAATAASCAPLSEDAAKACGKFIRASLSQLEQHRPSPASFSN